MSNDPVSPVPPLVVPPWNGPAFWITVVHSLLAIPIAAGMITYASGATLEATIVAAITAIGVLISNAYVIAKFFGVRMHALEVANSVVPVEEPK